MDGTKKPRQCAVIGTLKQTMRLLPGDSFSWFANETDAPALRRRVLGTICSHNVERVCETMYSGTTTLSLLILPDSEELITASHGIPVSWWKDAYIGFNQTLLTESRSRADKDFAAR